MRPLSFEEAGAKGFVDSFFVTFVKRKNSTLRSRNPAAEVFFVYPLSQTVLHSIIPVVLGPFFIQSRKRLIKKETDRCAEHR